MLTRRTLKLPTSFQTAIPDITTDDWKEAVKQLIAAQRAQKKEFYELFKALQAYTDGLNNKGVLQIAQATISDSTITLENDSVTYAQIQNVSATDKVLGRSTAGAGDVEEITCTATGRSILDDTSVGAVLTTLGIDSDDTVRFGKLGIGMTATAGDIECIGGGGNTEWKLFRSAYTNSAVMTFQATSLASWAFGCRTTAAAGENFFSIYSSVLGGNVVWISPTGNFGIGTGTFGTSAEKVLSLATGTAPTTGPADTVQVYSSDDAAGHTIPSFFCEGTNVIATGQADSASSVRVKMRINGTVVTLLAI